MIWIGIKHAPCIAPQLFHYIGGSVARMPSTAKEDPLVLELPRIVLLQA
jgi:hypothetical protein